MLTLHLIALLRLIQKHLSVLFILFEKLDLMEPSKMSAKAISAWGSCKAELVRNILLDLRGYPPAEANCTSYYCKDVLSGDVG